MAGVKIVYVQQGQNGLSQMSVGGQELPMLSYNSVDEIGYTEDDRRAETLYGEYLSGLDDGQQRLASYQAREEAWYAQLPAAEVERNETASPFQYVSLRNRRGRNNGCQPCQIQQLPACNQGGGYAYVPGRKRKAASYRQCQQRKGWLAPAHNQRTFFSGGPCEDCNLGLLAGPKALFNGDFIKKGPWVRRLTGTPKSQIPFFRLKMGQRLGARLFPRVAYRRGAIECGTAQAFLGQRFLAIMIGVAAGTGGGGGAAIPIFIGQNDEPQDMFNPYRPPALELIERLYLKPERQGWSAKNAS